MFQSGLKLETHRWTDKHCHPKSLATSVAKSRIYCDSRFLIMKPLKPMKQQRWEVNLRRQIKENLSHTNCTTWPETHRGAGERDVVKEATDKRQKTNTAVILQNEIWSHTPSLCSTGPRISSDPAIKINNVYCLLETNKYIKIKPDPLKEHRERWREKGTVTKMKAAIISFPNNGSWHCHQQTENAFLPWSQTKLFWIHTKISEREIRLII